MLTAELMNRIEYFVHPLKLRDFGAPFWIVNAAVSTEHFDFILTFVNREGISFEHLVLRFEKLSFVRSIQEFFEDLRSHFL